MTQPKTTALDRYLERPEPAFHWEAITDAAPDGGDTNLRLVSQTWQKHNWTHRLQIFRPKNVRFRDAALINVNFGSGSFVETLAGRTLADVTGVLVVNLFDVPNQPLFDRTEDDLVAYTFGQALQTGDESWPLLFPMTKSVIKTMDTVQAWSKKPGNGSLIQRFIVSGSSKRGWTTYLTGTARDSRVVGLIPIVYDNLNLAKQIPHQKEIWGETSPLAAPYAAIGLFDKAGSPEGEKMISLIDPYVVKERLTMPKLLIHATNDGYWPQDSSKFFFNDLPGDNRLCTLPNAPHELGASFTSAASSAAAWGQLILSGAKVPTLKLQSTKTGTGWSFKAVVSDASPQRMPTTVRLWMANAPTRDFRHARWNSFAFQKREGSYALNLSNSQIFGSGVYTCAFADMEIPQAPLTLRLSSQMWDAKRP